MPYKKCVAALSLRRARPGSELFLVEALGLKEAALPQSEAAVVAWEARKLEALSAEACRLGGRRGSVARAKSRPVCAHECGARVPLK